MGAVLDSVYPGQGRRKGRDGLHDRQLVYRKALRKRLDDYEASAPHVVAARKLKGPQRRIMSYVITTEGPEPADERQAAIDHEHYVQKQVRAVAQPVDPRAPRCRWFGEGFVEGGGEGGC